MMQTAFLEPVLREISRIPEHRVYGRVSAVLGMLVEIAGIESNLTIGARCALIDRAGRQVGCEIVGFRNGRALAMAYGSLEGVGLGSKAIIVETDPVVRPTEAWLGRVINAFGEPIDGKGPLPTGNIACRIRANPPPAHARSRVGGKIDLGVRSLNTFTTCCLGQRMGIFAASGVGKSVLLSMIARYTSLDINVIGL
ncbi:MAG TPA: hypothetical protein VN229_20795, partial [Terriglobales bacterium]|nr:hypothetical protein [Terriglobales bacterium]